MPGKKKGLSFEEKRNRLLAIFYDRKEVLNLKELEKLGPKKGIILQAVKDVNQSLVDDSLVETDKIGIGTFFWALPSQGLQTRQNLLQSIGTQIETQKKKIEDLKSTLKKERSVRGQEGKDGMTRAELLQRYESARKMNEGLTKEMSKYHRLDPDRFESQKIAMKQSFDACNRWVDNLFILCAYIKKKNPSLDQSQLEQQFEILQDLDYIDPYDKWVREGGEEKRKAREREKRRQQEQLEEEFQRAAELDREREMQREQQRQKDREEEEKNRSDDEQVQAKLPPTASFKPAIEVLAENQQNSAQVKSAQKSPSKEVQEAPAQEEVVEVQQVEPQILLAEDDDDQAIVSFDHINVALSQQNE